jgi:hypothetical protein
MIETLRGHLVTVKKVMERMTEDASWSDFVRIAKEVRRQESGKGRNFHSRWWEMK